MQTKNPDVDRLLTQATQWQAEMTALREICLGCDLTEEVKWGRPSYAHQGGNVVLIQNFKDYCALLFFKGALVQDTQGLLHEIGQNTQSGRQLRFVSLEEIEALASVIEDYVEQAIAIEEAGLKVPPRETADYPVPKEFQMALEDDPALLEAFEALTPGRQHQYLLYFANAKQSKTRAARVEKHTPRILEGKGLNDE